MRCVVCYPGCHLRFLDKIADGNVAVETELLGAIRNKDDKYMPRDCPSVKLIILS